MSLRIEEIEISNVMGIGHAVLKPGALTIIRGGNGAGKTSLLEAINGIFEGGHNPELIRRGEEQARVTMRLSDGVTIEKLTTQKDSYLKITTADGLEVKSPKKFVDSLASSFAFDPIAFMTAAPKERLKFLLEAMPVEFGIRELADALPADGSLKELLPKEPLDLAQFGAWLEQIRERRKVARQESETIQKTCKSLKGTLPKESATEDWDAVIIALEADRQRIHNAEQLQVDEISAEAKAESGRQGAALTAREAVIRAEFEAAMQVVRQERIELSHTISTAEAAAIGEIRKVHALDLERVASELATARENSRRAAADGALRAHFDQQSALAGQKYKQHLILDGFVERLEDVKKQKLDDLPVPGLEVRNGQIFSNGLDYDKQVNTGQQFKIAVQISALRFGGLPFMIADKGEHLDGASWDEIREAVEGTDIQILMTCVDPASGPLRAEPKQALQEVA